MSNLSNEQLVTKLTETNEELEILLDRLNRLQKSIAGVDVAFNVDSLVKYSEKIMSTASTVNILSGALGGNKVALTEMQKEMPMTYQSLQTLEKSFRNFRFGIENGNYMTGLTEGFKVLQNNMNHVQKGIVGVSAGFAELSSVKNSVSDMITETDSLAGNIVEMGVSVMGAGAAFSSVFGFPTGVVVSGIMGVIGAIAGIGEAFEEIEAEKFGESVKTALSNPGGVPIDELTSDAKSSIEQIGESFSLISEKANNFEFVGAKIRNITFEIEKMKTSIEAGVVSADEAIPHLINLYGQLGDAISEKIGAAGDVLLATFASGSISAQAYDYAGVDAENTRTTIVQSLNEQQKAVYDLTQELTHLQETDPTNPRIPELLAQIAAIEKGSSDLTVAMGNLQVIASKGISWETYVDDEGLELESYKLGLEEIISAGLNVKESAKRDFAAAIIAAESLGNPALVEKLKTGLPQALQYVDEQVTSEAMSVANTMQTELIGNIENIVAQAEDGWSKMSWGEKLLSGFDTSDEYVQNAMLQYKTNCIDPFSKIIEEEYRKLGIKGAGWADEASQKIIDSMFNFNVETNYSTGEIYTSTVLNNNWREVIESSTHGIYELMKEKGLEAVNGLNTGVNENAYLTGEEIAKWVEENVISVVQSELDSHSPSKVMEEFGMNSVLGYNQGIETYAPLTTMALTAYVNSALGALGLMYGKMYLSGVNSMLGIYDGMTSQEPYLYAKAQLIADNIRHIFDGEPIVNTEISVPSISYADFAPYRSVYEPMDFSGSITSQIEVAVSNAMIPYLEQIANNTKEALNKEVSVNIGDREIARANARGQSAMGIQLIK